MAKRQITTDIPRNWNVLKTDLEILSLQGLSEIFHAISGKPISQVSENIFIPDAMLNVLNPDEILACLNGVYLLKLNPHIYGEPPKEFYPLINEGNQIGYPKGGLGELRAHLRQRGRLRFSDNSLNLKSRLEPLDADSKQRFMLSFLAPLRKSNSQTAEWDFYDPNCDGADKRLYTSRIGDYFAQRYQIVHESKRD